MMSRKNHFSNIKPDDEFVEEDPLFKDSCQVASSHELHDEAHKIVVGEDVERVYYELTFEASEHLLFSEDLSLRMFESLYVVNNLHGEVFLSLFNLH